MRMLAPVEMRRPMAASDNNQSLSDVRQLHPHWLRRIGRSGLLVVILALLLLIGNVVLYIPGLLWLQFWLSGHGVQTPVWEAGLLPFVWGDIIKLILAASVVPAAWRFVGRSGLR